MEFNVFHFYTVQNIIGCVQEINFFLWPRNDIDKIICLLFSRWKGDGNSEYRLIQVNTVMLCIQTIFYCCYSHLLLAHIFGWNVCKHLKVWSCTRTTLHSSLFYGLELFWHAPTGVNLHSNKFSSHEWMVSFLLVDVCFMVVKWPSRGRGRGYTVALSVISETACHLVG